MKQVRVFKNNIRENVLQSLFFNRTMFAYSVGAIFSITLFGIYHFLLHIQQVGVYLLSYFVLCVFILCVGTIAYDGQPISAIFPRLLRFSVAKKQHELEDLGKNTSDFVVTGDFIMRKKNLLSIYRVLPYDIALLQEQERDNLYACLQLLLHTLPSRVQIIAQKKQATKEDYYQHFFSVFSDTKEGRTKLVQEYIASIEGLLLQGTFEIIAYYAVFTTPLSSHKKESFMKAVERLTDFANRFQVGLGNANMGMRQLAHAELVAYCRAQIHI